MQVVEECGACHINKGTNFCVRCKRSVCDLCWDEEWDLCADCAAYKRGEKWNLSQSIMNSLKIVEVAKEKLNYSTCETCVILRNHILHILKVAKDVEYCARTEALLEIESEARKAREALTDLSIRAIVKQKMKAPRELWRKL